MGVRIICLDTCLGSFPSIQNILLHTQWIIQIAPSSILGCALTGVGLVVFGYSVYADICPILQMVSLPRATFVSSTTFNQSPHQADSRVNRIFIIPIALFHIVVAFFFGVMFFSYYVVMVSTPDLTPPPSNSGPCGDIPVATLF